MNYTEWTQKAKAFSFGSGAIKREIILPIAVKSNPNYSSLKNSQPLIINGLVDTGANTSLIDSRIAQKLGLIPTKKASVGHAQGTTIVDCFSFDVILPDNVSCSLTSCPCGSLDISKYGMLIGMDILSLGEFYFGRKFINNVGMGSFFTFAIPSLENRDIDFAKELKIARRPQLYTRIQRVLHKKRKKH